MYILFMHTSVPVSLFGSEDSDNQEFHVFPLKYSGFYKVHIVKSSWFALQNILSLSSLRITVHEKGMRQVRKNHELLTL